MPAVDFSIDPVPHDHYPNDPEDLYLLVDDLVDAGLTYEQAVETAGYHVEQDYAECERTTPMARWMIIHTARAAAFETSQESQWYLRGVEIAVKERETRKIPLVNRLKSAIGRAA